MRCRARCARPSLALGATRWQTIRNVLLPQAMPGILTGAILSVSRGAGEVAPIMFTGAAYFLPYLPTVADRSVHGARLSHLRARHPVARTWTRPVRCSTAPCCFCCCSPSHSTSPPSCCARGCGRASREEPETTDHEHRRSRRTARERGTLRAHPDRDAAAGDRQPVSPPSEGEAAGPALVAQGFQLCLRLAPRAQGRSTSRSRRTA